MGDRTLDGEVAVVTGACHGIGRGIAWELGAAGATVYMGSPPVFADIETLERIAGIPVAGGGLGAH